MPLPVVVTNFDLTRKAADVMDTRKLMELVMQPKPGEGAIFDMTGPLADILNTFNTAGNRLPPKGTEMGN